MSSFDGIALLGAASALIFFSAAQAVLFRSIPARNVLAALKRLYALTTIVDLAATGEIGLILGVCRSEDRLGFGLSLFVSWTLSSLLALCYVLFIFGPFESSIRLRLIRELGLAGGEGLSQEEILMRYCARDILDRRLERLVAAQELSFDGRAYRVRNRLSFFLGLDLVSRCLSRSCIMGRGD